MSTMMREKQRTTDNGLLTSVSFPKAALFINSVVPLALLGWDALHHNLGANPLEFVTRTTGMLTLIFLTLSLAITPARKMFGWNFLTKYRRMIGLFAFFYGFLHLLTYVWFDRSFNLKSALTDIFNRPFIAVGLAAFLIMVPLAITSTSKMIKRLGGKRWSMLHKTVYLAGILGALHFWLLVKSDTRLPVRFIIVLAFLLGYRLFTNYMTPKTQTRVLAPPR
jgi:sulfoxide reductase heme-binding subunit YedZ